MSKPSVIDVDGLQKRLQYSKVDLKINGERVQTRIADTQQKRYIGLSDTEELGKNEGMLFMYPVENEHRLVMRDMDFSLDVIHVDGDGKAETIDSMSESGEGVQGISKYAIELPHGWCEKHGVEEGDTVRIVDPPDTAEKSDKPITAISKARRYVDSPDEVPDAYEVQEGPQGGLYYETENESEEEVEEGEIDPDELSPGDIVWVDDKRDDEPILCEIVESEYGLKAVPLAEGDERGLSITGLGGYDVVGMADEDEIPGEDIDFEGVEVGDEVVFEDQEGQERVGEVSLVGPYGSQAKVRVGEQEFHIYEEELIEVNPDGIGGGEEVDFDALTEGDEIIFEDYHGDTRVGEVSRLWDERENITVIADGSEYAVHPDDFEGMANEYEEGEGIDISSDDLTGMQVELDTGERAVVVNGEKAGLEMEILTGSNAGEDIYGISRSSVEEVVEEDIGAENLDEGWESPNFDDMELEEQSDWVRNNGYVHQKLKVYDRATGEVREGFFDGDKYNPRTGNAYVQVKGGDKENYLLGISRRFNVVGAKSFDSLDENEKHDSLVKTFQYGDFRSIGEKTRSKVQDNFFGRDYDSHGSLRSAKSWETKMKVAEAMSYLKNRVKRASCGGSRGSGAFHMNLGKEESDDTIAHELGHGIAVTFGYDYEGDNATEEYGPHNLSHDYTDYTDGKWSGFIDWDLSEDSPFYDPEEYMFTKWTKGGEPENYAVGKDSFMDEVEQEVQERFGEEPAVNNTWTEQDYESPDEDATARQIVDSLEKGSLVKFNVPDWDAGRDDDGNPADTKPDYAKFSHIEPEGNGDNDVAIFKRANGDNWRWPMDKNGELYSDWSSITGVATNFQDGNTEDSDTQATGGGGMPPEARAETLPEHLNARWDGFNSDAEKPQEKANNLMRAVNRAWYKQAKVHEATDRDDHRQKVVMETGYSATNAHETMAQLHEVMQTPTEANKQRADDIFDEHPYLVLAYMDMWDPSPEMMEEMQELFQALGIEL